MKKIVDSVSEVFYRFLSSYYRNRLSSDIGIQLRMRALDSTCEYIEKHLVDTPYFTDKQRVIDFALSKVQIKGLYCEFGVYKGKSVNYIARKVSEPVHAFDSFEGLPENWSVRHKKGLFALNKIPVFENNVIVHKGWFEDTLPLFIKEYKENGAFIHIDSDLYSSARSVFHWLDERIVENTIILFDEYFNYPFWKHHEFKAFQEFVQKNNVRYEYLCYCSVSYGSNVAVRILGRD
jgi:Methyltransferase domain